MSSLEVIVAANINLLNVSAYLYNKKLNKNKSKKKYSAKWLLQRESEGFGQKLLKEIQNEDIKLYRQILRMTPHTSTIWRNFGNGSSLYYQTKNTNLRNSISSAERLQVTLRYLATGETQTSLQLPFRIHQSTISKILKETVEAIYTVLNEEVCKFPETENDWLQISNDFHKMWGFPNCLGAIDGKHCKIRPLKGFASNYWCYKGTHTFVLMAIADAHYRFIYADVGINGRIGDAGIWMRSDLKYDIEAKRVPIPPPRNLPLTCVPSPFTFLSDDAFPLTDYMMKPYAHTNLSLSERRFNYMLSRNSRVVENAFGILANRFQVLFTPIFREPSGAIKVALACICLHNYLRTDNIKRSTNFDCLAEEEIDTLNQRNFDSNTSRSIGASRKSAKKNPEAIRRIF